MKESKRIVLSDKLKVNLYETLKNNRVAKAILELFYGVKWNMLHGSKEVIQSFNQCFFLCVVYRKSVLIGKR